MGSRPGQVRYDNLKSAVAQVLGFTRARTETDRWTAFRSHYDLRAFCCRPGVEGAHEKGGVEGDIGWFRRNHLVPVPEVDSIDELNAMIEQWDAADDTRRIGSRPHTVGQAFALEAPLLRPLPEEPFETGRWSPRGSTGSPRSRCAATATPRCNRPARRGSSPRNSGYQMHQASQT